MTDPVARLRAALDSTATDLLPDDAYHCVHDHRFRDDLAALLERLERAEAARDALAAVAERFRTAAFDAYGWTCDATVNAGGDPCKEPAVAVASFVEGHWRPVCEAHSAAYDRAVSKP